MSQVNLLPPFVIFENLISIQKKYIYNKGSTTGKEGVDLTTLLFQYGICYFLSHT